MLGPYGVKHCPPVCPRRPRSFVTRSVRKRQTSTFPYGPHFRLISSHERVKLEMTYARNQYCLGKNIDLQPRSFLSLATTMGEVHLLFSRNFSLGEHTSFNLPSIAHIAGKLFYSVFRNQRWHKTQRVWRSEITMLLRCCSQPLTG